MSKLPIGIQTFSEIREEGYVYVDKTRAIHNLVTGGKVYFLSRPRRFGKSLLVSTLEALFRGQRGLFEGLWICDHWDFEESPVVKIDFSGVRTKQPDVLVRFISNTLTDLAAHNGVDIPDGLSYCEQFHALLGALSRKGKVAVLVDEYDKPIIDHLDDPEVAVENRDILQSFYSVLKKADPFLRFVLITGVSKFTKTSVFSGLNQLRDITLAESYSTMLGYTQDELATYLGDRMDLLRDHLPLPGSDAVEQVRDWYNGYSWDGKCFVYNPFSILNLLESRRFSNYWFASGTPTFLVKCIRQERVTLEDFDGKTVGEEAFDAFDADHLDLTAILFQTGYLTIGSIEEVGGLRAYHLTYPNVEVRHSLAKHIMADFLERKPGEVEPVVMQLKQALMGRDLDRFLTVLRSVFAGIPAQLHIAREAYYHSLFYMLLTLMGAKINLEVLTDKGRVDAVVDLPDAIYVVELKMGAADDALTQIKARRYQERFLGRGKPVYLLGIGGFGEKDIELRVEEA